MNELIQEAIDNSEDLKNTLRYLAGESAFDEETGDATEWSEWSCLFRFSPEEVELLAEAFPKDKGWLEDCGGVLSLSVDSYGFRVLGYEADYRIIERSYHRHLEELEAERIAEQDRMEKLERIKELSAPGPCDSCQVVSINGIRCHEHGCPRGRELHNLCLEIDRME